MNLVQRLGRRRIVLTAICLAGLIITCCVPRFFLLSGVFVGGLFGTFVPVFFQQKPSDRPIGTGWKVVWAICILLSVTSFVAAAFGLITFWMGVLFAIIVAWGLLIYRHQKRMHASYSPQ